MNITIDRDKFKTETGKKLYDMLKDIWDNPEFILGVLLDVKGDKKKKKLIKFIENGVNDTDEIIRLAMAIDDGEI